MVDFTPDVIYSLFGAEDAENESPERLKQYFVRNRAYESLKADLPIRIVVGHKGVGKSALLKMAHLEDVDANRASIWLQPSDLITLDGTYEDRFDKATLAWQNGLLKVIYDKVEDLITDHHPDDKSNLTFSTSKDLVEAIKRLASKHLGINGHNTQSAIVQKFQTANTIYVYLDDLDRGWKGSRADIHRISALLNSLRDICGEHRGIQFCLGLRTDVYHLVRTSDESTDKVQQYIIPLVWTNNDILVCMAKRVATYFGDRADDAYLQSMKQSEVARLLHKVIQPVAHYAGKWNNAPIHIVLLSLTRRRPRDLVKLFSGAAKVAYSNNHKIISDEDLRSTFADYSQDRLQDIINEFRSELPNINDLLMGMRPNRLKRGKGERTFFYTNDALSKKIKDICSSSSLSFANGSQANYHTLKQFLYKIDFLLARDDTSGPKPLWYYFDQNRFAASANEMGFNWEVHPAYRWALEKQTVQAIMDDTELFAGTQT